MCKLFALCDQKKNKKKTGKPGPMVWSRLIQNIKHGDDFGKQVFKPKG